MTAWVLEDAIAALRQESLRLLSNQQALLTTIQTKVPSVDTVGEEGEFTINAITQKVKRLEKNRQRLDKLDMVLVVVGTMKAGKSTCINAIVGREVLPNRNRPMTALPTLIRHTPGRQVPVLHFSQEQQKPIQALIKKLEQKIVDKDNHALSMLQGDKELVNLAKQIHNGWVLEQRFEGETGIFEFLSCLNDLVRLAKELDVDFPFANFTDVDDYPVIEVEFLSLQKASWSGNARFSILDTPGFNEAGQAEHLKPMLQQRLEAAHAVLAVLDYSQLKSESDAELRKELEKIAQKTKNRIFFLINKIDEENHRSSTPDEIKLFAAEHLLKDILGNEDNIHKKIFPVSGLHALLSQRAKLDVNQLVEWAEQSALSNTWGADFGKIVFGYDYEEEMLEPSRILKKSEKMWERSNFAEPLQHVVEFVYKNATYMVIDGVIQDISEIILGKSGEGDFNGVVKMLRARTEGLRASTEEVEKMLAALRFRMSAIDRTKSKFANHRLDQIIDECYEKIFEMAGKLEKELQDNGSNLAKSWVDERSAEIILHEGNIQGVKFKNLEIKNKKIEDLDFYNKKFFEELNKSIIKIMEEYREKAIKIFNEVKKILDEDFSEFNKLAKKSGFTSIELSFPRLKSLVIGNQISLRSSIVIDEKIDEKIVVLDEDGFFAGLGRLIDIFDYGLGKRKELRKENVYILNMTQLQDVIKKQCNFYISDLRKVLEKKFGRPINESWLNIFKVVDKRTLVFKEYLQSSMEDHRKNIDQQRDLIKDLMQIESDCYDSVEDLKNLVAASKCINVD